jgi:hypothetical protein
MWCRANYGAVGLSAYRSEGISPYEPLESLRGLASCQGAQTFRSALAGLHRRHLAVSLGKASRERLLDRLEFAHHLKRGGEVRALFFPREHQSASRRVRDLVLVQVDIKLRDIESVGIVNRRKMSLKQHLQAVRLHRAVHLTRANPETRTNPSITGRATSIIRFK